MSRRSIAPPVVLLAGDAAFDVGRSPAARALRDALDGFEGTLISGGTDAGVASLAAVIGEHEPGVRTIGYVPTGQRQLVDDRYDEVRFTSGDDFSLLEPLEAWADIVTSGIDPATVRLIGIGGGTITAQEYRLALLMGASIGIVTGTGRAVADLLEDDRWRGDPRVVELVARPDPIRAFIDRREVPR